MIAVLVVLVLLFGGVLRAVSISGDSVLLVLPVGDFGGVVIAVRRLIVRCTGRIESGCCGQGTDTILLQIWCSAMH